MEKHEEEKGEERRESSNSEAETADFGGTLQQAPLPSMIPVDVMPDMEADDLIFSDDAFPSLPDFPCLSSPAASPSPSEAAALSAQSKAASNSSNSSSSSSSSPWAFLHVSGAAEATQQPASRDAPMAVPENSDPPQAVDGDGSFDILGGIDLFPDSWDSETALLDGEGAGVDLKPPVDEEVLGLFAGEKDDGNSPSEDLAKVFLDWLRNNKDSISLADLRSIKLKRSTVECAARRLGGGKQGRVQLLKLILVWVQNHHLQKRRHRNRMGGGRDFTAVPADLFPRTPLPPENMEFNYGDHAACSSLTPYSTTDTSFPAMMPTNCGDLVLAPTPYRYYPGGSSGSVMLNSQPLTSPEVAPPEFHAAEQAASAAAWPQGFSPAMVSSMHYSQFSGSPSSPLMQTMVASQVRSGFPGSYGGGRLTCFPGLTVPLGIASATKEARKRRMARQRRFSSLHHHKTQQINQQPPAPPTEPPQQEHESSNLPHLLVHDPRNRGLWSSSQQSAPLSDTPATAPPPPPPQTSPPTQQRNSSPADKYQGWKADQTNLRFLLQKVLKQSDVGNLGRIVLPKREAEIHLPELDARDGISIEMEDIGTSQVWNMRYRFWPNNKSRMYLLENTGDFVRSNGLQEGDFIVIYSDVKCGKYMIRGVKVRQPADTAKGASSKNAVTAHQKINGSVNFKGKSSCAGEINHGMEIMKAS